MYRRARPSDTDAPTAGEPSCGTLGNTPKRIAQRMATLAGRSGCRRVLLAAFCVFVSRMNARRGVQEAGRNARRKQAGRTGGHVTLIGVDESMVRAKDEKAVIDAATGEGLELDVLGRVDTRNLTQRRKGRKDAIIGNRPRNGGRKIRREILIQLGNHSAPTRSSRP